MKLHNVPLHLCVWCTSACVHESLPWFGALPRTPLALGTVSCTLHLADILDTSVDICALSCLVSTRNGKLHESWVCIGGGDSLWVFAVRVVSELKLWRDTHCYLEKTTTMTESSREEGKLQSTPILCSCSADLRVSYICVPRRASQVSLSSEFPSQRLGESLAECWRARRVKVIQYCVAHRRVIILWDFYMHRTPARSLGDAFYKATRV